MEPTMEAGEAGLSGGKPLGAVVQIDDGQIRAHLDEVVRATVEETLNALLDAEADQLCGARKYERTEGRKDTRAGSYDRQLHTKAGEVTLQVPRRSNSEGRLPPSERWEESCLLPRMPESLERLDLPLMQELSARKVHRDGTVTSTQALHVPKTAAIDEL
jgi:hypothetical protein